MERTERELSSGKSILEPSDNPQGASQAIALESALGGLEDYETSANDGTAWLDAANGALTGINEAVQRVRELVVQAGNGTNSQANLDSIASEVEQLTQTVKQDADTQYAGQYIFSGTQPVPPLTSRGKTTPTAETTARSPARSAPRRTSRVTVPLNSLLGEGTAANDGKLLDTLRTDRRQPARRHAGRARSAKGEDLGALETNLNTLDSLQATVGSSTDQITAAMPASKTCAKRRATQLSNIQDANIAQVSIEYSNEQAAFTAALRAGASIVQSNSLLEFLH